MQHRPASIKIIGRPAITLRQLLLLQQVVEHGFSVTAAAEALYTAQSGVSKQLKALADELGVELFQHEGRRLVGLTPIGEQVAAIAERMLRDADAIRAVGQCARQEAKGRLTVVATRHTANVEVRSAVLRFQRMHANVALQVSEQQPEIACKMVNAGEVEVGVVPDWHVHAERLRVIPLVYWRLVIVAPAGHWLLETPELTLRDLAGMPVACYENSSASRRVVEDAFARAGLRSPVAFELASSEDILDYAASGASVGIVAKSAASWARHPGLDFRDADGLFPPMMTSIIVRRDATLSWVARDFIELLREESASPMPAPEPAPADL